MPSASAQPDVQRFRRRTLGVVTVLLLGLTLALWRAGNLQILQHESLSELARGQYLQDIKIPAKRGHIYDRHGKPMALSVEVPSVYANPQMIADPRQASHLLASILGLNVDTVYQRLASDKYFVWLKRLVTPQVADEVRQAKIRGVALTKEPKRFYPNRELAAHILGFAGMDGKGLEGIERSLEEILAGELQAVPTLRDARGNKVLQRSMQADERGRGADVYLTLDLGLQHATEIALQRGLKKTGAKNAMAVVLDVESADILALAVEPSFNPNNVAAVPSAQRRNRVITDMFEPGSTMKPIVVAAALEQKTIKPDDIVFCENGSYSVGSHTIRDGKPYGWLDLKGILQKSSNIGAVKVGRTLGKERLAESLRSFGFGAPVDLAFPGESAGLLRDPGRWSPVGEATIAFGHGVAVTALQLAAAYRVLAADGLYRRPNLIARVERRKSDQAPSPTLTQRRVLSGRITEQLKPMLQAAAGPEGTGNRASVPGFQVAGKTGTAQKIDAVTGSYSSDKFMASFAGFLPAEVPRVVIVVVVDEPEESVHTGGAAAAPIFSEIGAAAMRQLGVHPSADVLTAKAPSEALSIEQTTAIEPEARLVASPGPGNFPSFLGLSARQAVAKYTALGLTADLQLSGSGLVVRQTPSPGSKPADVKRLQLVLEQR